MISLNIETSKRDLEQKRAAFFKSLRLQQKLNKTTMITYDEGTTNAAANAKNNVTPNAPPQKTLLEEAEDTYLQQQRAFENLKKLMRPDIAKEFATSIDLSYMSLLNTNFNDSSPS